MDNFDELMAEELASIYDAMDILTELEDAVDEEYEHFKSYCEAVEEAFDLNEEDTYSQMDIFDFIEEEK